MRIRFKRICGQPQLWIETSQSLHCLWWDRGFRFMRCPDSLGAWWGGLR